MTAKDGPYLVTNVTVLRTPLGGEVPVPPQLALCRCGASALKPFCDGSHATSGFTDGKDPNRVPDQRDTYPGQVTILDNRASASTGLCSDRAPTASKLTPNRSSRPAAPAWTSCLGSVWKFVRRARAWPSTARRRATWPTGTGPGSVPSR